MKRLILDFPPEIRDLVYKEVLAIDPQPSDDSNGAFSKNCRPALPVITIEHHHLDRGSNHHAPLRGSTFTRPKVAIAGISLRQTNRQIYHEAAAVLYGSNVFVMEPYVQQLFIEQIGQSNAGLIRYLHQPFDLVHRMRGLPDTLLARSALQTLEICLNRPRNSLWIDPPTEILKQIDRAQKELIAGSDVRVSLVVHGKREAVLSDEVVLLRILGRGKHHGWKIRRVHGGEVEDDFDVGYEVNSEEEADSEEGIDK